MMCPVLFSKALRDQSSLVSERVEFVHFFISSREGNHTRWRMKKYTGSLYFFSHPLYLCVFDGMRKKLFVFTRQDSLLKKLTEWMKLENVTSIQKTTTKQIDEAPLNKFIFLRTFFKKWDASYFHTRLLFHKNGVTVVATTLVNPVGTSCWIFFCVRKRQQKRAFVCFIFCFISGRKKPQMMLRWWW